MFPKILRSKSGCMTCRIRKVKCDEEKPSCYRCRSTGRRCDGYTQAPTPDSKYRNIRIIQYAPILAHRTHGRMLPTFDELTTEQEWRSWEFFHIQTASCFGTKTGEFLLSAANTDPSIRAAVLALGSLHRIFLHEGDKDPLDTSAGRQLALRQYDLALRTGCSRLSQTSADTIDAILIMCLLFFCFECLQGHYQAALRHAASGVRILQHQEQLRHRCGGHSYRPHEITQSVLTLMENQLLEVDGQLSLPENMQPYRTAFLHVPFESPPATMLTLEELGDAFRAVYNRFLHVLSSAETPARGSPEIQEQMQEQYRWALQSTDQFSMAFSDFLAKNPLSEMDYQSLKYAKMLQMWQMTVGVVLKAGWPPSDSEWDRYTAEYKVILSLAEDIISMSAFERPQRKYPLNSTCNKEEKASSAGHNGRPNDDMMSGGAYTSIRPKPKSTCSWSSFSFSLGVLPVLWIVASSCRDYNTRYWAIDLMRRSNRQEGIWNSRLYARLAMRVAQLEEQAAGILKGDVYEPSDIPMSARVLSVMGRFHEGKGGTVQFVFGSNETIEECVHW
ncbi:hypothetical protein BDV59DRAFT_112398 [Aspergillus ambiguus]|uniref:Zn(II)2Cys6 transcription factor n=1 Tax=Aspergillus ambiguus TaxID=176160 RepID=UPI003CCCA810